MNLRIAALVTPIICPPLSNNTQPDRIPTEFKTLKIADSVNAADDQNVDILVGNDNYAHSLPETRKSQRTNDG